MASVQDLNEQSITPDKQTSQHTVPAKGSTVHERKPSLHEVFELLKDQSSEWDSIGRAFGVSLNFRKELRKDISLDDCGRLEWVLHKWLETSTNCTWEDFIQLLRDKLQMNEIARTTELVYLLQVD